MSVTLVNWLRLCEYAFFIMPIRGSGRLLSFEFNDFTCLLTEEKSSCASTMG